MIAPDFPPAERETDDDVRPCGPNLATFGIIQAGDLGAFEQARGVQSEGTLFEDWYEWRDDAPLGNAHTVYVRNNFGKHYSKDEIDEYGFDDWDQARVEPVGDSLFDVVITRFADDVLRNNVSDGAEGRIPVAVAAIGEDWAIDRMALDFFRNIDETILICVYVYASTVGKKDELGLFLLLDNYQFEHWKQWVIGLGHFPVPLSDECAAAYLPPYCGDRFSGAWTVSDECPIQQNLP